MKTKFYYESVGECVSQVYELNAKNWDDAKKEALQKIDAGDHIAECIPAAVKDNDQYPEYAYIEKGECENYATLQEGTWARRKPSNSLEPDVWKSEYWEGNAFWFDDDNETFLNRDGSIFTNWETEEE